MVLAVTNFNIVTSVLGGWVALSGLFLALVQERFYISEASISLLAGVVFTHVAKWLRPLEYAGSPERLDEIMLDFSRLVLGLQLVIAGVQLPHRYLRTEWRSLALLLGPGMVAMWACGSTLIWALVPGLPFLHALAIGACVTPTDPILSNTILKGKFADENVPKELQHIIIAESGANDGLGYPFLFFALYLIKYATTGEDGGGGGVDAAGGSGLLTAMGLFLGKTCVYVVLLSVAYGWAVGWTAKGLLRWAGSKQFVDRESFLFFPVALALFIVGVCGMAGSDDVLACFIAGNAFTWDDWFRLETLDDSLQPTIDMLLNMAMFMWLGATCPWESFWSGDVVPPVRLVALGVLVMLLRRLPVILALHRHIHQVKDVRQAAFMGYFGPIGVSAIFYLYVGLEFLKTVTSGDGQQRADAARLGETMTVVIWFLIICSVVVHGLSIPLCKLGFHLRGTLSRPIGPIALPV